MDGGMGLVSMMVKRGGGVLAVAGGVLWVSNGLSSRNLAEKTVSLSSWLV
jgi:hypothetical protein